MSTHHPEDEVCRLRATFADCRRRLLNIVIDPEKAAALLDVVEEFGSQAAIGQFADRPMHFGFSPSAPLLQAKSLGVLKEVLAACEQAQWDLDKAIARRETAARQTQPARPQIVDFRGREAEIDFEREVMTFRDGERETVSLIVEDPEMQRSRRR